MILPTGPQVVHISKLNNVTAKKNQKCSFKIMAQPKSCSRIKIPPSPPSWSINLFYLSYLTAWICDHVFNLLCDTCNLLSLHCLTRLLTSHITFRINVSCMSYCLLSNCLSKTKYLSIARFIHTCTLAHFCKFVFSSSSQSIS